MPHICLEPSSSFLSLSEQKQKCIPGPLENLCFAHSHSSPAIRSSHSDLCAVLSTCQAYSEVGALYFLLLLVRYIDHLSQISASIFRSVLTVTFSGRLFLTLHKPAILPLLHPTPPHLPFPLPLLYSQLLLPTSRVCSYLLGCSLLPHIRT